ncbi:hypothetical protein FHG87_023194 [Trinorchestia longiramus]|nr:hypothetical protein FHG87_023194 [Trinorchestia longiramus]
MYSRQHDCYAAVPCTAGSTTVMQLYHVQQAARLLCSCTMYSRQLYQVQQAAVPGTAGSTTVMQLYQVQQAAVPGTAGSTAAMNVQQSLLPSVTTTSVTTLVTRTGETYKLRIRDYTTSSLFS